MVTGRPRFSARLPPHGEVNAISRALQLRRARGESLVDLTESNPTAVGLSYPPDLLAPLGHARALRYDPASTGLRSAREAVAADYGRRGVGVHPEHVVLAASTSDLYGWLFKLLCDPGDAVLVPRPSYPLFEHLTRLEAVRARPYDLRYHGRWEIDFASIVAAPDDVRAVLLVSPNNPTGSYVSTEELARLSRICHDRRWAIVADEVFAEYPLDGREPLTDIALHVDVLSFSLGGASKLLGLPQVKLAWTVVGGAPDVRDDALGALAIIADTYLSVGTPVQGAAADLFERGAAIRAAIQDRTRRNLVQLRRLAQGHPSCDVLGVDGGWCAVVRVPATRTEETLVLDLIDHERVLVHPGYFFDFPHEAFVIVSLLAREVDLADGCERMLRYAESTAGTIATTSPWP